MQFLQRAAGTVFVLILSALLVFWTVKDTKPSGSAVFPVLYGALVASAVTWLGTELLRRWAAPSGNARMNRLMRHQWRTIKWRRGVRRLLRRPAPKEEHLMRTTEPPPMKENERSSPAKPSPRAGGAPVRAEHGPLPWDQVGRRPAAGEEEVPLQPWLEDRIAAHAELARQRAVRGDPWFFQALGQWDVRNTFELEAKVAPDLVDAYYRGGGTPGYVPGNEDAYYDKQLAWLKDMRRGLRDAQTAPDRAPRDEFLKVLAQISEQGGKIPFPDTDPRAYGGWSTWAHRQIAAFDVAYAAEFKGVEDTMTERQRKIQDIMRAVRTSGSHLGPGDGSREV